MFPEINFILQGNFFLISAKLFHIFARDFLFFILFVYFRITMIGFYVKLDLQINKFFNPRKHTKTAVLYHFKLLLIFFIKYFPTFSSFSYFPRSFPKIFLHIILMLRITNTANKKLLKSTKPFECDLMTKIVFNHLYYKKLFFV